MLDFHGWVHLWPLFAKVAYVYRSSFCFDSADALPTYGSKRGVAYGWPCPDLNLYVATNVSPSHHGLYQVRVTRQGSRDLKFRQPCGWNFCYVGIVWYQQARRSLIGSSIRLSSCYYCRPWNSYLLFGQRPNYPSRWQETIRIGAVTSSYSNLAVNQCSWCIFLGF